MSKSFDLKMFNDSGVFNTTKTEKELILQNLKLLLQTHKGELLGDPYFGTDLVKIFFDQNDRITQDLIIDEIYESINLFMSEITVTRKDIKIVSENNKVDIVINFVYNKDGKNDLFNIQLIQAESSVG
jgi:phage baseplate assembly protein W